MNKRAILDLLKEEDPGRSGTLPSDLFTSVLQRIEVPLDAEEISKLLAVYDKKGEGVVNYDDFLSEQKYIHAVSSLCTYERVNE